MLRPPVVDEREVLEPNGPQRDDQQIQERNRTDWTARLPDELLVAIIDRLPSLRDKLQVESVSRKFQRCFINLFNIKPLPFELEMGGEQLCFVNGYPTDEWEQLSAAVQTLARKTKFRSIVCERDSAGRRKHRSTLDRVFSVLIASNTQCLDKVVSFQSNVVGKPARLHQVLAKCGKLSSLKLDDVIEPEVDLGPALSNKALTHLTLFLVSFSQAQLVGLLQSIQPNMLKTFRLECDFMALDPVALVRDLGVGAWAALEAIDFDFGQSVTVQWADLFASLGRVPQLHKCSIKIFRIDPDQFVSALTALFSIPIELVLSTTNFIPYGCYLGLDHLYACELVNRIRQVQAVHPALQIDFDMAVHKLKLSLARVSFEWPFYPRYCNDHNCINCGSFYPTLIKKMSELANEQVDAHLDVGRLDRCRIDRVVDDLNYYADWSGRFYTALAVETIEALATITFESETKTHLLHQFKITVVCGSCLSNSCIKCVPID